MKPLNSFYRAIISILILVQMVSIAFGSEKGAIKGKVENESGKAINGAQVVAERDGEEVKRVKTNEKGEFIIEELEVGDYLITADAEGYKSVQIIRRFKVESGKTTKIDSKIVLPASKTGSLIRGAVFTERGFSIAGAKVEIELLDPKGDKFKKQYTTNSAGEFAFRVPETGGKYQISASASGFEKLIQTIELSSGESRSLAFSLKAK
jgi:uncharacterized surface anchored protein